mgnify:FL=1
MAIPNKTYSNLIDKLKNIGDLHHQISTTTVGDIYRIDLEKNTKYPLFHINPVNVTTGRVGLTYTFQLFVMDLVDPGLENEEQVYSDVLQICVDLISIFRNSKWQSAANDDINKGIYFTQGDYTLEPFTERFDQEVTGWVFQIGIVVDNDFQSCDIPMTT